MHWLTLLDLWLRKETDLRNIKYKKKFLCNSCRESLQLQIHEEEAENYKLIKMRSKGYLLKPSILLLKLITDFEKATLSVINSKHVHSETLFEITAAINNIKLLPTVGCEDHANIFMERIIAFYLSTRMFFITKQMNKNWNIKIEKTREERKLAKLASSSSSKGEVEDSVQKAKAKNPKSNTSTDDQSIVQKRKRNTEKCSSDQKKKKLWITVKYNFGKQKVFIFLYYTSTFFTIIY